MVESKAEEEEEEEAAAAAEEAGMITGTISQCLRWCLWICEVDCVSK